MNETNTRPSGAKIRAIIKRPDEKYGHVTNISPTLKNLQKTVDGYIETVHIGADIVLICNEMGKVEGLKHNFWLGNLPYADKIVGTVIIVGEDGDDFADCPISFQIWKDMLDSWGN